MNRALKITLMGLALVLFVGSFFLKKVYPANPDLAEYIFKGVAIAILALIVIRTRLRKKPTDLSSGRDNA